MAGYTVGVDVGGTKVLAAVVDPLGQVVSRAKLETPLESSDSLMATISQAIRDAIAGAGLEVDALDGIGLGVPGVCGPDGACIWAPNCPLTGVPVAELIQQEFGRPTAVGNDVNVGTLGEKAFGAGREFDDVFGMFVGTGIGGGLVIGGRVVIGAHCLGAEVGHIIVNADDALAGVEGGGEFEYYASRLGIERHIRAALESGRESLVAGKLEGDDDRLKSGTLKKALAAGDEVVCEVVDRACRLIGLGCVTVIHLVDPQAIILGGGVIEACGEYMVPRIEETIAHHVAPGNGEPIRLVVSELGDDAVLLGAAALARGLTGTGPRGDYPTVACAEFGVASVNGEEVTHDLVVRANGKVKKRRKKLSREVHGTAHEVSRAELEYICRGKPEALYVGAGHQSQLGLSDEGLAWLEKKGIAVFILPSPAAAAAFSAAPGRKALLLHVTC